MYVTLQFHNKLCTLIIRKNMYPSHSLNAVNISISYAQLRTSIKVFFNSGND